MNTFALLTKLIITCLLDPENGATKVNNDEDMDLPLFDLKTIGLIIVGLKQTVRLTIRLLKF